MYAHQYVSVPSLAIVISCCANAFTHQMFSSREYSNNTSNLMSEGVEGEERQREKRKGTPYQPTVLICLIHPWKRKKKRQYQETEAAIHSTLAHILLE